MASLMPGEHDWMKRIGGGLMRPVGGLLGMVGRGVGLLGSRLYGDDPEAQRLGLLALGSGLSQGGDFGSAALMGREAVAGLMDRKLQAERMGLLMDQMRGEAEDRKAQRAEQDAIGSAMRMAGLRQPGAPTPGLDPVSLPRTPSLPEQYATASQSLARQGHAGPSMQFAEAAQMMMPKPKEIDPSSNMKDYMFYYAQEIDGGRQPLSFGDWEIRGKRAGATNVSMNAPYETTADKGLAEVDSKRMGAWQDKADKAAAVLPSLQRLRELNSSSYQAGTAEARLATVNFFEGLGISIDDPAKLANSTEYQAIAKKIIFDMLGSLGNQISNADRSFIENITPKLGYSAQAREQLIGFLEARAQQDIGNADAARDYYEQNRGLKGYRPYQKRAKPSNAARTVRVDENGNPL